MKKNRDVKKFSDLSILDDINETNEATIRSTIPTAARAEKAYKQQDTTNIRTKKPNKSVISPTANTAKIIIK